MYTGYRNVQIKVPEQLQDMIKARKGNLRMEEWYTLSSLVLLHVLGHVPDAEAAKALTADTVHDRVRIYLGFILEGKDPFRP